ncbi:FAD-dependent oxidoreductase [Microbacterium sp. LRZ72]|uniref:FAD-dependent oxidoreductase n=1 Tax=Microbacterium sp. LRZ72 TaxID=2942481 RepID=UPI0029BD7D49|nr:FAD-dependent oxidoreductase [Microbacterium sp. LRZ72]MDX2378061.1 FAD-dependent oxidoreductase [Microbacterium sp. LRZ72]
MAAEQRGTDRPIVCVAGGGPAGIVLGLLLARAGIRTTVLEKHEDFFRDFRGDTVHPSTMNLIDQLGLRTAFDAIPPKPLPVLDAVINGVRLHAIDFRMLPPPNRFVTLMPQGDLLDMLAAEGARHPGFDLRMGTEVTGVLTRAGRVSGVRARTAESEHLEIEADLVVGADGRGSALRGALGLRPKTYGVPIDVVWFRLPEPDAPMPDTLMWASAEGLIVTIPRPGYYQCGMLIPKGSLEDVRRGGIAAFRERVGATVPRLRDATAALTSLDEVALLSVQIDRLARWWRSGALCIGDAAHAMSPAFGVGINYAVQDAAAAANALVPALAGAESHAALDTACAAVQRRRALPTAAMQLLQRGLHRTIATGRGVQLLDNPPTRVQRAVIRALLPGLRPVAARVVGYGFRPERLPATAGPFERGAGGEAAGGADHAAG